jgi:regulator of sigma E protease
MWLLFLGLILFIGLVLVHEWGHYILARRNGVEVEEFGLFFPPRIKVLTRRNGTDYTLNWLPLGGFVKMKGENDADTSKGSFGAADTWAKTKIMLAGVAMNLIAAFVLLTLVALIGMPKLLDHQFTVASDTNITRNDVLVGNVEKGSPAAKAGLKQGDKLVTIGVPGEKPTTVKAANALPKLTHEFQGKMVVVQYEQDGQLKSHETRLRTAKEVEASKKTDQPKGYLGLTPAEYTLQKSTWSAPVVALGLIKQFTLLTFQGLGTAISSLFHGDTQKASEQVSGPVGIFVVLKQGTLLGIQYILLIIAIISLSLALMNALPIPALDGGRLFVMLVSRALHKPITPEVENAIHGAGFLFLLALIVLISIVDVKRFF